MSSPSFTIQALQLDDVPTIADMSEAAFEKDRNTEIKALGSEPFDMKAYTLSSLPDLLQKNPRCIVLKAVDNASGEIMGFCNWGFRGFEPDEMPVVEGRIQPPPRPATIPRASGGLKEHEKDQETFDDPIKRLEALTDRDMNKWIDEEMPDGSRCLYIIGLSVLPKFHRRGAGSALLKFGTDFCDQKGVCANVHSSEGAWKMYEKSGFQTIRELDIDLDEYSPGPPPGEGPDAKWGHYVFHYMKYMPQGL